jgi:integrase
MRKAHPNLVYIPAMKDKKGREKLAHWLTEITVNYRRVRRYAGATKEEALIYLGGLRKAAKDGKLEEFINPKPAGDTFGEYARGLLDSAEWKAKRSHRRDEVSLKRLNRSLKNVRLADINPALVRDYMTDRSEKDGMSPATVNRELSFLKSVLFAAECDQIIASNPIRGRRVKKFKEAGGREKAILEMNLGDEDQARLIGCAGETLKPILKVALITGMRLGEILKMKWAEVDFRLSEIRIPEENSKSKKERFVPMDAAIVEALDSIERNGDYIFFNPETGTHIVDIRRPYKAALEAAKIKGLRFHDLRHLAASRLVKVTDVVTASKILGHSSLDMTLRYVHSAQKDRHAAIEKAAENLFRPRQDNVNAENGPAGDGAGERRLVS